jgi:surfeit locus 1 family protein
MPNLHIGKYRFKPKLIPTMATIILVPFLISLGLWQLDRAEQKKQIDNGVKASQAKEALNLNSISTTVTSFDFSKELYRTASLKGVYDNQHQYLLDNRTYKGRAGFHVLTPFILSGTKQGVLINRGWIAYQGTRENIPDINVTTENLQIKGVMKQQTRAIVLKEMSDTDKFNRQPYPKLVQSIQLNKLANDLGIKLLPLIIELNKADKTGFSRDWQPYYGSIDKHNAYALQWFVMAAILLFLYIKLNTKKSTKA